MVPHPKQPYRSTPPTNSISISIPLSDDAAFNKCCRDSGCQIYQSNGFKVISHAVAQLSSRQWVDYIIFSELLHNFVEASIDLFKIRNNKYAVVAVGPGLQLLAWLWVPDQVNAGLHKIS